MKIQLEELPHQEAALEAIDKAFYGLETNYENSDNPNYIYANPLLKGRYKDSANIDVKMETGTRKTYVYTRMMYEMHQKYGIFKFIIVVPSPAIKKEPSHSLTVIMLNDILHNFTRIRILN